MGRTNDIPLLEPEDAAAVIRTAFGLKGWQVRVRSGFRVSDLVAALWVAARECDLSDPGRAGATSPGRGGKEGRAGKRGEVRLRDVLRWARRMEGKR